MSYFFVALNFPGFWALWDLSPLISLDNDLQSLQSAPAILTEESLSGVVVRHLPGETVRVILGRFYSISLKAFVSFHQISANLVSFSQVIQDKNARIFTDRKVGQDNTQFIGL